MIGISLAAALAGTYLGYNVAPIFLLGALLFFVAGGYLTPGGGGKVSVNRGPTRPASFESIGGQAAAIGELKEGLEFLVQRDKIRSLGIRTLRGILLSGPPGTGKTLLARAAAGYTNSAFHSVSGSEFIEMYAGVGAQRVRAAFNAARHQAKKERKQSGILFIDEIEILGGKRGRHSSHLEYDQTLNQLLVEMDGISGDDGVPVLVIAATNRADLLDDALLRPGRFDRAVHVDVPDRDGRKEILEIHTREKPLAEDVDLDAVAREAFGFSGAHLESLTNEAAILALRDGYHQVHMSHFREAVDKVMMGERSRRRPSREELERVAVHELGHALIGEMLRPGWVAKVSIASRGAALGYVRQSPAQDVYLRTRQDVEDDICCYLAGMVAEEIMFGSSSTGAAQDLEQASQLARNLVHWGLGPLGLVPWEKVPEQPLYDSVRSILSREEKRARDFITRDRDLVRFATGILLEQETISGDDIRNLLAEGEGLSGDEEKGRAEVELLPAVRERSEAGAGTESGSAVSGDGDTEGRTTRFKRPRPFSGAGITGLRGRRAAKRS